MASKRFTETSKKPYNRHQYKLVLKSGKEIVEGNYEVVRAMWFQWNEHCSHVEILDK